MSYGNLHPLPVGDWTIVGTFSRSDPGSVIQTPDEHHEIWVDAEGHIRWRAGEDESLAGGGGPVAMVVLRHHAGSIELRIDGHQHARWTARGGRNDAAMRLMVSDAGRSRDFAVYSMCLPDATLERLWRNADAILLPEPAAI